MDKWRASLQVAEEDSPHLECTSLVKESDSSSEPGASTRENLKKEKSQDMEESSCPIKMFTLESW